MKTFILTLSITFNVIQLLLFLALYGVAIKQQEAVDVLYDNGAKCFEQLREARKVSFAFEGGSK